MNKLKEARIKTGKTQEEISKEVGIAVSTYNMYEKETRRTPIKTAKKIAQVLNVDVEDIFLPQTFTVSKTK